MSQHISHLKLGNKFFESRQWEKALKEYEIAHQLEYRIRDGWINQGFSNEYLGKFKNAVECYSKLLDLSPKNKLAWNFKGRAYQSLGRCDKAIPCFQTAVKIDRLFLSSWLNLASAYACLQLYDQGMRAIKKCLELNASHEDTLVLQGKILRLKELFEDSLQSFNQVLQANPTHIDALLNKGYSLGRLDRYEEAAQCFDVALKQKEVVKDSVQEQIKLPKRPELTTNELVVVAKGYLKIGKLDLANEYADKTLTNNQESADALFIKGSIAKSKGNLKEADKYLTKALKLNPKHESAKTEQINVKEELDIDYFVRGKDLFDSRDYDDAIISFDKLLLTEPEHLDGLFYKGLCHKLIDDVQNSLSTFKQLALINKDYQKDRIRDEVDLLSDLLKSRLIKDHLDKAEEMIKLGKFDNAIELYLNALNNDMDNISVLLGLAAVYELIGDLENALAQYNRAHIVDSKRSQIKEKIKELHDIVSQNALDKLIEEGNKAYELGEYQRSLSEFDKALVIDDSSIESLHVKSKCLHNLGRLREAYDTLERLLEISPDHLEAALEIIEIMDLLSQIKIDKLLEEGDLLFNDNNCEGAISQYDQALEISPNNVEIMYKKCLALLDKKNYAPLESIIADIKNLTPEYNKEEINDILNIIEKDKLLNKLAGTAHLHYDNSEFDMANSLINEILMTDPNNLPILILKSKISHEFGKIEDALTLLDKINIIDNNNKEASKLTGKINNFIKIINEVDELNDAESFDDSLKILQLLLNDYPNNEIVINRLALIETYKSKEIIAIEIIKIDKMIAIENFDQAINTLKQLLDTYPENEVIKEKIIEIEHISADLVIYGDKISEVDRLIEEDKLSEAEELLKSLSEEYSDNEDIKNRLSKVKQSLSDKALTDKITEVDSLINEGKLSEAEELLKSLSEEYLDNEYIKNRLSKVKQSLSDKALTDKITEVDSLINEGKLSEAEELLKSLSKEYIDNEDIKNRLSKVKQLLSDKMLSDQLSEIDKLIKEDKLSEAEELLKSLSEEYPDNEDIKNRLSKVKQSLSDKALTDKITEVDSLINEGKLSEAEELLKSLSEEYLDNEYIKNRLSKVKQSLSDKALTDKITEVDSLINEGKLSEAEELLKSLSKEYIDNEDIKNRISKVKQLLSDKFYVDKLAEIDKLIEEDKLSEAEELLKSLSEEYPDNEDIKNRLSKVKQLLSDKMLSDQLSEIDKLIKEDKLSEAEELLKSLSEEYPDNEDIKNRLSKVKQSLSDKALTDKITEVDSLINEGKLSEAEELLKSLSEEYPANEDIKNRLSKVKQSLSDKALTDKITEVDSLINEGKLSEAEELLKSLSEEYLDNEDINNRLSKVKQLLSDKMLSDQLSEIDGLIDKGKLSEAEELLKSLSEEYPDNEDIKNRLSKVKQSLSDKALTDQLSEIDKLIEEDKLSEAEELLKSLSEEYHDNEDINARLSKVKQLLSDKSYGDKLAEIDKLIEEDKLSEAEELLKSLSEDYPDNEGINTRVSKVKQLQFDNRLSDQLLEIDRLINEDMLEEAIKILQRLSKSEENKSEYLDKIKNLKDILIKKYISEGIDKYNVEKYLDTAISMDKALKHDSNNIEALYYKGLSQKIRKKNKIAHTAFDRVIKLDNEHAPAHYEKGDLLLSEDKLEEAVKYLERSVEIVEKKPETQPSEFVEKAKKTLKTGQKKLSFKYLDDGNIFFKKRKYKKAIDAYIKTLILQPNNKIIWNNRGLAHKILKDNSKALECYHKAVEIDSNFKNAWNNIGAIFEDQGEHDKAIEHYDKALKIDPKYKQALNNKGLALHELERYKEAVNCYVLATKIDPKYKNPWCNQGTSLGMLKKHKDAILCFEKALSLDIKYINAMNGMGTSLIELKKYEESISYFNKVLEIDNKFLLSILGKGIALSKQKKQKEALEYFEKALILNRNYAPAWWYKGEALYNLKSYKKAVRALERALRHDPSNSTISKLLKSANKKL